MHQRRHKHGVCKETWSEVGFLGADSVGLGEIKLSCRVVSCCDSDEGSMARSVVDDDIECLNVPVRI
jgi:hypothetical protein